MRGGIGGSTDREEGRWPEIVILVVGGALRVVVELVGEVGTAVTFDVTEVTCVRSTEGMLADPGEGGKGELLFSGSMSRVGSSSVRVSKSAQWR